MSTLRAIGPSRGSVNGPVASAPRTTNPVKFWALIGALMWTFQIYVLIKWLTGPYMTSMITGQARSGSSPSGGSVRSRECP